MSWIFSRKKEDFFLVLDIGTKAVKSLFCFKNETKLHILSGAVKNFSQYESHNQQLVESAKATVSDSFKNGIKNISFSTIDKEVKNSASKQRKWKTILTFSPDVFKARIVSKRVTRENKKRKITPKEEKKILKDAAESAKKEVLKEFSLKSGIQSSDIYFVSSKAFDFKIDGYSVDDIDGFEGKEIEVKIIFTFIPLSYWKALMEITNVLKKEIKIVSIIHLAEGLLAFKDIRNGLFIDIGGRITQYFRVKNSQLAESSEFDSGASGFSELLSNDLGIGNDLAENMQELYSDKLLSRESSVKVKEIFSLPKNNWYNRLIEEINKKDENAFSPYIYLFGGGGALPEIQDVFKERAESSGRDLYISGPPETNLLLFEDLKNNAEDTTKKINKPQWTPAALIANKYAQENI